MINELQWNRSRALAAAHSHHWTYAWSGYDGPTPESWDAAVSAFFADPGVNETVIGLAPSPTHRTASGRVAWAVEDDGSVTVQIHRPGGEIVISIIWSVDGQTANCRSSDNAMRRHWDAAALCATALEAVGCSNPIEEVPNPTWEVKGYLGGSIDAESDDLRVIFAAIKASPEACFQLRATHSITSAEHVALMLATAPRHLHVVDNQAWATFAPPVEAEPVEFRRKGWNP